MANIEKITGHYIDVKGARIYFDEIGEGVPVICIHPGATDSRIYRYFLPLLANLGYRAIAPDFPGHNRSLPINWSSANTIHDHAEFIHSFAQALLPGEKPVVMGASVGGVTVLDLIAHHSDSYCAAIAMQAASWTPVPSDKAILLKGPAELQETGWTAHIEEIAISSASKILTESQKTELRWLQRSNPQTSIISDGIAWSNHDIRGKLGNISCPVLIIQGMDDFFIRDDLVDDTVNEIGSKAELIRLENIGHYPPFENPELIAKISNDFLKNVLM